MTVLGITYDAEADAAYVALADHLHDDALLSTRAVELDAGGPVLLELDEHGRLVGVEVLRAARALPHELLSRLTDTPDDDRTETDRGPA